MATKQFTSDIKKWRNRKAQMIALIDAGTNMAEIGRRFNISRQRVRQITQPRARQSGK